MNKKSLDLIAFKKSVRLIERSLINYIMNNYNYSEDKALETLCNTKTYEMLKNKKSEMYLEPPGNIVNMLSFELNGDYNSWLAGFKRR